jgi:hypothetical protein
MNKHGNDAACNQTGAKVRDHKRRCERCDFDISNKEIAAASDPSDQDQGIYRKVLLDFSVLPIDDPLYVSLAVVNPSVAAHF